MLHALGREPTAFVGDHARQHFRDTYDHTMELLDITEGYREIGSDLRDIYLASVSNRMNEGSIADAYKQEHEDLIDSIRAGTPIVELRQMADSSLVGVLGRLAAYTGQKATWKFVAEESQLDLFPKDLTWQSSLPSPGFAVPGKTKLTQAA